MKAKTLLYFFALVVTSSATGQRMMENLSRGLVAVKQKDGRIYVGWRLLATDPDDVAFNLYRTTDNSSLEKINKEVITNSTNYVDAATNANQSYTYTVKAVVKGKEQEASKEFVIKANAPTQQCLLIPLQIPPAGEVNNS